MNIEHNKDLTYLTTMKTKCVAEHFVEVDTREAFLEAIRYAHENKLKLLLLGGGSNTVIIKDRIAGLVVKNRYSEKEIVMNAVAFIDVRVTSGYVVARLVREMNAAGYQGLEYHLGLPGTVGGALYMNSKWIRPESYFSDTLTAATIADKKGKTRGVNRDYFHFAYDYSLLQETEEYIVDATFRLTKALPETLEARAKEAVEYRNKTQPVSRATSGCFFQNIGYDDKKRLGIDTSSAGYLIDRAGLKGARVGSFMVSEKHANFIIDEGEGKPEDLKTLMDLVKLTVKEQFGVTLLDEVRIIS